jgi:hypothetical protein
MPEGPLAQKEGDDRFGARLNLPGFRQVSDKSIKISVVFDQPVEDERVDVAGGRILGKNRIEKRGIPYRADDQLVDPRMRLIAFKDEGG